MKVWHGLVVALGVALLFALVLVVVSSQHNRAAAARNRAGSHHIGPVGQDSDAYTFFAGDTRCVLVEGRTDSVAVSCDWGH